MTLSPDEIVARLETAADEQAREWREDGVELHDLRLGAVADLEVDD